MSSNSIDLNFFSDIQQSLEDESDRKDVRKKKAYLYSILFAIFSFYLFVEKNHIYYYRRSASKYVSLTEQVENLQPFLT